jgi:hypothetical protein
MKTAAAILTASMLLQEPEKVDLYWNPPPGRIIVTSLSVKGTLLSELDLEVEAEAELHPEPAEPERRTPTGDSEPLPPKGKPDGGMFMRKGIRYFATYRSARKKGSFLYERGKEPVIEGDRYYDAQKVARFKVDFKTSITDRGYSEWLRGFEEPFDEVPNGVVQFQLPPMPVKEGIIWVTGTDFSRSSFGGNFKGKLKYTVKSVEPGQKVRIDVVPVPDPFFDDGNIWAGNGELTYSFKDQLISSSSFTLTKKNKQGKLLTSFRQVVTQKLKPQ